MTKTAKRVPAPGVTTKKVDSVIRPEQRFTTALVQFTEHLIAQGHFGAGLQMHLEEQVQDVVFMLLYKDKRSTKKVTRRLGF
jgi:hypothetical protein